MAVSVTRAERRGFDKARKVTAVRRNDEGGAEAAEVERREDASGGNSVFFFRACRLR